MRKPVAYTIFFVTPFLIALFVWFFFFFPRTHVLTVAFLDIGQGDAIFIETPSGKQILVDGGPGTSILGELSKRMSFFDRTIDVVIATHPDADHIGGLPAVFDFYRVLNVFDSGITSDTATFRAYAEGRDSEGARYIKARRGQLISFGDGTYLRILYPDRDMEGIKDTNSASVVLELMYGETDVILTGDAPKAVESYLVSLEGDALQADILKAGHHGSKTSSGEDFIAAVHPAYTVISAGAHNRYGHPNEEVVERLTRASTTILSTYELGTIVFESDGESVWKLKGWYVGWFKKEPQRGELINKSEA